MEYLWYIDLYMKNGKCVKAAVKSIYSSSKDVISKSLGIDGMPDTNWTVYSSRDLKSVIVVKIGEIAYMDITPAGSVG